jgi:hypothetical protein
MVDGLRHDIGLVLLRLGTFFLDLRGRVRTRDDKSPELVVSFSAHDTESSCFRFCNLRSKLTAEVLADLRPGEVIEEFFEFAWKGSPFIYPKLYNKIKDPNRSNTSSHM